MLIAQLTGSQMVLPYLKCPWGKTINSFIYTTKSKHSLARETGLISTATQTHGMGKFSRALPMQRCHHLSPVTSAWIWAPKRHWERDPTSFDKFPATVHSSGPARQGWQHGTLPRIWDGSALPTQGVLRVKLKLVWKQNLNSEQAGKKHILTLKHTLKSEFRYVLRFFSLNRFFNFQFCFYATKTASYFAVYNRQVTL